MTFEDVQQKAELAQKAVQAFRKDGLEKRASFFQALARLLLENCLDIIQANQKDLKAAQENGLSSAMIDRLTLNEDRITHLSKSVQEIAAFPDPLDVSEGKRLENGLILKKVKVGIGVVGFIYESRPNVTIDAVALCVKSGNAVLLKGGKEAVFSNIILESICRMALQEAGLPDGLVSLLDCTDREVVGHLVRQQESVDIVIPRGGKGLIQKVVEESLVPVIKHDAGNCHIYVHESANQEDALDIIENAKTQRPGVCNAVESLVVDASIIENFLPKLDKRLKQKKVEIRYCPEGLKIIPTGKAAQEEDYGEEYLDLILSVKVVSNIEEAIEHIDLYSSGHTEAILTNDLKSSKAFLERVDSSVVLCNASTRFSDGGQFGLGAEIGISTNRLHARGPMGAAQLTTYKYIVEGDGQIRV